MKVFIGCSSKDAIDKKYFVKAREISEKYSSLGYDLIFGCMPTGLMGETYRVFKKNNRKIISVIEKKYKDIVLDIESDQEIIVNDIYERTKALRECDLAIFLPGGYGTIGELSYFIDAKRNGEIDFDILIVNDYNFFDPILKQYQEIVKENFGEEQNIYKVI